jgi:hypothetical protein
VPKSRIEKLEREKEPTRKKELENL